jgi:hypothetical protein
MEDEERIVEVIAQVYGFEVADVAVNRDVRGAEGSDVRFVDLARFANMNGVNVRRLAEFIARETAS